jgi:hypothetical protein
VAKARQIHKADEANISAYFPADRFSKHNVPVSLKLGEGQWTW